MDQLNVSVEDVLNKLSIIYTEKSNRYMACCPFHSENTPSFAIYKNSGHYTCFGCGVDGSIFELVYNLKKQNLYDFMGIENNGIPITYGLEKRERKLKNVHFDIEGEMHDVYSNQQVLDYCWSIGLTNSFIEFFNVKYSTCISINPVNTPEDKKRKFYNRIIIPCAYKGFIYNYECRDFTKKSSTKVLYPSGSEPDILFNYDNLDFTQPVFRTEGIKGLSTIWSDYSHNVVSTFGKAIKDNQRKLLATIPILCDVPDNDENKINKKTGLPVDNVSEVLKSYEEFYPHDYYIAYIPDKGKDPNNLHRERLKYILDNRKKASEILIERYDNKLFHKDVLTKDEYFSILN